MFKKSLLIVAFFATAIVLTGCNTDENSADVEEKVDYIVTTVIPTKSNPGLKDKAPAGFVKLDPHFDTTKLPTDKKAIKWFKKGLGSKIPAFPEGKILEVINTDDAFVVYIANVDEKMFQNYFEKLASVGYKFNKNDSWESMNMQNDKYAVNMRFSQDGPNVTTVRAKLLDPSSVKPTADAPADKASTDKATEKAPAEKAKTDKK